MGRPKGSTNAKKKALEQKPLRRCLGNGCNKMVRTWFCWHCAYEKDRTRDIPVHRVLTE